MALAYLLDPNLQIQNQAGVNNVDGFIRVFMDDTDDRAVTYSDFAGSLNPADIPLDNNGRCVIIADSEGVYRVEVYDRNGALRWTQYPLTTMAGGGGASPVVALESSDGSIEITRTSSGGKVTYDLSAASDDPSFTEWAKCSGANTPTPGIMIPLKADGNMDVTADGITLKADNLYHITARFAATKTATSPYYDKITIAFNTYDGEQTSTEVSSGRIVDYSMGLEQEFEISADIKVGTRDVSLYFSYAGQDASGGAIRFRTADVHMLNSGVPHIPGGMASREWVSENYQEKLTAGEGITIEDNVISADASQQVQSNWTEQDTSSPAYIQNKPSLATVATSGSYNDLTDKPDIPSQQVQSDWTETNTSSPAYIKHKPDMDSYATDQELTAGLATKQDVIQDIADIRAGAQRGATAVQPSDLAAVATSGSYNDLSDKPSIPAAQVQSDWDQSNSAAVDFIKNKPTIPVVPPMKDLVAGSNVTITEGADSVTISASGSAQVQSDWAQSDSSAVDYIKNKPDLSGFATQAELTQGLAGKQDVISDLATIRSGAADGATAVQPGDLATVATSGSYNDLSDKPSIPAAQVQSDWGEADSSAVDFIKNKPNLATVATSGDYNDLSNKPSIPAAPVQSNWNETDSSSLAYIQNKPTIPSVPVQDVTVNGSSVVLAGVAAVTVPEKTSDLTNDSGFITSADIPAQQQADWNEADNTKPDYIKNKPTIPAAQVNSDWNASSGVAQILNKPTLAAVATTGAYSDLSGTPSIPTATSDLTNDSGFITASDIPAQVQADWNETDNTKADYIKNKPSIPAAQVNSDWNASSGIAQILNKPSLATVATSGSYNDLSNTPSIPTATSDLTNDSGFITSSDVPVKDVQVGGTSVVNGQGIAEIDLSGYATTQALTTGLAGKQDTISDLATIRSGAAEGATAVQPSDLATVATSGSYNDLSDKPSIPAAQVNSDWNASSGVAEILNKPQLSTVATTGDYNDLSNKPSIPAAQVNSDWNAVSGVSEILNKPTIPSGTQLVPAATSADANKVLTVDAQGIPEWAVVPPQATGLFEAVYGTTTLAEVLQAISDKKIVYCVKAGILVFPTFMAHLVEYNSNRATFHYLLSTSAGNTLYIYAVTSSGWTDGSRAIQVNSDWNATSGAAEILNKPTNLVQDASYVHTDNNFTTAEKDKLAGVQAGAEVNVQSDWTQSDSSADDYIKNKPSLAAVATSGDYNDLSNTPTIPAAQVNSDWNASSGVAQILNKPNLAAVATSGDYGDLSNTPTIPAAQVQSNWTESDTSSKAYIQNKPTLAAVATSGDYADLSNTPTIPAEIVAGTGISITLNPGGTKTIALDIAVADTEAF